ncbi:NADH-quinone oxidoreductase subunit J family protein [Fodinicola feengrottensis]|uniref:NADH-quinone oxidoreductase subunit J n=1 Tax=Fodinicola feengrottensis TaxID=435914 RepID=A0ABP4SB43_9ACTN|nr:NADH-quinone oxidoreductase subunit J [Fodinicola feengrottensis]
MTGLDVAVLGFGLLMLAAAVAVVTTKQLVHAALWLVVSFAALAACYLLLTAEIVAWVQVLIYVGAIVVLLLFGIMLTRSPTGPSSDVDTRNRWPARTVALAVGALLASTAIGPFWSTYLPLSASSAGSAKVLGTALFRFWVLPFELLSLLLLAALVAAVVLTRAKTGRSDRPVLARSSSGRGPAIGAGRR